MSNVISICMFCGSDPDKGNHSICKDAFVRMKGDLEREEMWVVMQKAEHGFYGKAPHRAATDPTDWIPRAVDLRRSGLRWREVADALNQEGFVSKHGHKLDAALLLNNLKNRKL